MECSTIDVMQLLHPQMACNNHVVHTGCWYWMFHTGCHIVSLPHWCKLIYLNDWILHATDLAGETTKQWKYRMVIYNLRSCMLPHMPMTNTSIEQQEQTPISTVKLSAHLNGVHDQGLGSCWYVSSLGPWWLILKIEPLAISKEYTSLLLCCEIELSSPS